MAPAITWVETELPHVASALTTPPGSPGRVARPTATGRTPLLRRAPSVAARYGRGVCGARARGLSAVSPQLGDRAGVARRRVAGCRALDGIRRSRRYSLAHPTRGLS